MENAKQYAQSHHTYPSISLKEAGTVTVELVKDKLDSLEYEGQTKEGVRFLVKHNGELKSFFTASPGLISQLSPFNPGDTVTIVCKSRKTDRGYRTSFKVFAGTKEPEMPESDAIPVVGGDESGSNISEQEGW